MRGGWPSVSCRPPASPRPRSSRLPSALQTQSPWQRPQSTLRRDVPAALRARALVAIPPSVPARWSRPAPDGDPGLPRAPTRPVGTAGSVSPGVARIAEPMEEKPAPASGSRRGNNLALLRPRLRK